MHFRYQSRQKVYDVEIEHRGETFRASVNGEMLEFQVLEAAPGELTLLFDGHPLRLYWAADGQARWLSLEGCSYLLGRPESGRGGSRAEKNTENVLRAPMPAQVRLIQAQAGEQVEAGQMLLALEAMKMEIRVTAPRRGKVRRVLVELGQTVQREQSLIELE